MNTGHNVFAIHENGLPFGRAQSHVQDRALLRHVDLLAAEHRIDARAQSGFLRQLQQQLQGLIGNAILRVVEVNADGFGGKSLTTGGVIRKELRAGGAREPADNGPSEPSMPRVL